MYRIRFETNGAFWVIEVATMFGLLWRAIRNKEGLVTFDDLGTAHSYVVARGINQLYHDRSLSMEHSIYAAQR